ncbi:MAG: shikimate kinase [Lachnospiraceae bacterium]|nr:shikimate kinase [Lachnospiraceae bacterium]
MSSDNITLIGMPGAGKSTVGIVLAKVLGYDFIDSDLLIQKSEGMLLWQIIESRGIDGFHEAEERVNAGIDVSQSVIATGGSVIYGDRAMSHLKSIGKVVYLKIGCEELTQRLGDLAKRGVTIKPGQTLGDLYAERVPLYEKYADITVNISHIGIAEAAEKVRLQVIRETRLQRSRDPWHLPTALP